MSASFENSAEVTELEKVNFLSNPKERQYQRMFKLLYNCPHFTQCSKYRLTPSQPHTKALLASVLFTCQIIPGFQPKNQKICQRQLCIFSNRKSRGNRNQFIVRFFFFFFFFSISIGTFIFLFFFKFYFIFKLYIIVLVLTNIKMNPPQVYMCSPS